MITDYINISLPSTHPIVILDTSKTTVVSKDTLEENISDEKIVFNNIKNRIPMTFSIDYETTEVSNPPPLTLLINPKSMNFALTKKIGASFARRGYVVEDWGGMQDVIKCDGKIGGYYISNPTNAYDSGLNNYDRRKSNSFRSLYSLFIYYRNNGTLYKRTSRNKTEQTVRPKLIQNVTQTNTIFSFPIESEDLNDRILRLGKVLLHYDGIVYQGAFDEFSIEEDAGRPYNLNYNFQFTVQYKIATDYRKVSNYKQTIYEINNINENSFQLKTLIDNAIAISNQAKVQESQLQSLKETVTINPLLSKQIVDDAGKMSVGYYGTHKNAPPVQDDTVKVFAENLAIIDLQPGPKNYTEMRKAEDKVVSARSEELMSKGTSSKESAEAANEYRDDINSLSFIKKQSLQN